MRLCSRKSPVNLISSLKEEGTSSIGVRLNHCDSERNPDLVHDFFSFSFPFTWQFVFGCMIVARRMHLGMYNLLNNV
uniref:Uncharacterized protein n=1 Tax=Arundo donax TaxID=35708 RepID=A0A0A9HL93_ARUDO